MALAVLTVPLASAAQPAAKVWRIGYLSQASAEIDKSRVAAFRQGLRELGYVGVKTPTWPRSDWNCSRPSFLRSLVSRPS
jgi:hypothetical protein